MDDMHIITGQILVLIAGNGLLFDIIDIPEQIYQYIVQCIVSLHVSSFHFPQYPSQIRSTDCTVFSCVIQVLKCL